tara:strand:+ start:6646 stop:7566 length:921 start_codon:yes stop_codon:yes gene_type:complete
MNNFISNDNKQKLFNGCSKLLSEKLNISVDENDLNSIIIQLIQLIKEKYNNDNDIDLKTLNNICLTNVKKHYTNENIDESLLQNKISDLELKRKEILKNYNNNVINSNNNNKSFIISSLNNIYSNQFDLNIINLNYNLLSFKPNKVILPKYINNIMPYISLNIYIDDNILTYNYICSFKNDIWDIWTTDDNYIFKISNNIINYSFTDYNNNIINFDLTKVPITNININTQYIYINLDRYITYFQNKDYIIIENSKKKYKKNIVSIDNNNIVIKNDIIDKFFIENLSNSNIILYENQFTLIMNYYSK